MNFKKIICKIVTGFLICTFLLVESPQTQSAHAASLSFYNLTTGTTENYKGKQVIYTYNGRKVPLSYPGIIVDGTALADCNELFAVELGLLVSVDGENITITDGVSTMILTFGSNDVTFNGEKRTTSIVPVKLFFEDSIKYYVPSRFVAEAFGFSYVWVSSTSTVKITKTLDLMINNKNIGYNGGFYTVNYDGNVVPSLLPMLYYNGDVYAPISRIFEAAGCTYTENNSTMSITKGELTLTTELNDKNAYLNGKKYIMGVTPVQITDTTTGLSLNYIPFEFAADLLGFKYDYNADERRYYLYETAQTGTTALYPELTEYSPAKEQISSTIDAPIRTIYFEWLEDNTLTKNPEVDYITKVCASGLENDIEMIELYGVKKSSIEAFMDNGLLVLELSSVGTNINDQFYSFSDSSSKLVYTLMTVLSDNIKLFVMPQEEIQWHITETDKGVQIYFLPAGMSTDGLFISTSVSAFPDDKMILPVPENIITQVKDQDNYLEKNFQIIIPGNHEEFYQNNMISNPYYQIKEHEIMYNPVADTTEITFYTRSVCAYSYIVQDGYLEVSVGRPNEFYSKIVVLDAGHGGTDPGASKGGYNEKDINFTILNTYTKELFKDSDIKVYFTRETDVLIDLYDRAAFASEVGADIFLSLHMNANNSSTVNGTEIFYSSYNNAVTDSGLYSSRLGKTLAENISSLMGTKNRGVSNSEFVVVKYNTVPAVLIELAFMTNKTELAKITDPTYQAKAAIAIYLSVVEIFELFPTGR